MVGWHWQVDRSDDRADPAWHDYPPDVSAQLEAQWLKSTRDGCCSIVEWVKKEWIDSKGRAKKVLFLDVVQRFQVGDVSRRMRRFMEG